MFPKTCGVLVVRILPIRNALSLPILRSILGIEELKSMAADIITLQEASPFVVDHIGLPGFANFDF